MKIFIQYKKIGISAAVLMVVLAVAGLSVLSVNLSDKVKRQAVIEARADMPGIELAPPAAKPNQCCIFRGNEVKPEDFVIDVQNAARVICSFAAAPDVFSPGWQEVAVILTDENQNSAEIHSGLYVFDFTDELVMEAGAAESAAAKDFIRNYMELEDLSLDIEADGVDFAKLGTYPVVLKMGQRQTASAVKIEDTTPPSAKPNQCRIFRGNEVEPEDFVGDIQDATRVICSFAAAPDVFSPGWQEAAVILTDESQNSAEIKSELYVFDFTEELVIEAGTAKSVAAKDFIRNYMETDELSLAESADVNFLILGSYPVTLQLGKYSAGVSVKIADTTPPVISGEVHKRVVTGGTISYRSNITVTDNYDQDVPLAVDSSGVNLNVPGTYTVIYSAADKSGNRAEVLGTVTVCEADMELVNEMADGILAQIIDQNMSRYEKAKAIFYWVHGKMKYTADINSREIAQGAYNCFYRGAGDCYTYMAASQVLLTRAGIDNMMVQRIGAPVPHYWNIVNVGDGWYHFDASPNGYVSIDKKFMFTESQAREFSRITPTDYENFKYDKSLVPEVVE